MKDLSPLVVGLDSSTTACKAIVWDCRGEAIAKGYRSLALLAPQSAWHEQAAESWWVSMTQAIRQAVSQVDKSRLKALCIAHPRETFVALDEYDRPSMNGIVWINRSFVLPLRRPRRSAQAFWQRLRRAVMQTLARLLRK